MLRVGLTGGVGSGKSEVADILASLGACVSRSDEVGRALMEPGQPAMQAIVAHFGPQVLAQDGSLNRSRLAQIAFQEGHLEELNALVHPAVIAQQMRWMQAAEDQDAEAVAVVESALIFETKHGPPQTGSSLQAAPWRTRFDRIVVVTAPEHIRRSRFIARTTGLNARISPEEAAKDFDLRAHAQWSDQRRAALADFVLENEHSLDDLRSKADGLYRRLRQESIERCDEAM